MHSCVTSKNAKWCHLIWPTLYITRSRGSVRVNKKTHCKDDGTKPAITQLM